MINAVHVFEGWFRVDARPFKHALLNIIKRWSFMFKQHLIDHVTNRSDIPGYILFSLFCIAYTYQLVITIRVELCYSGYLFVGNNLIKYEDPKRYEYREKL